MSEPSIALCIPAYNAAWCLPRLLASAEAQTVPFSEILVYDDCSTDDTAAVARQHGATVVSGDVNRGCSYGKNHLAEVATSEWLHFHDADDELKPNFVEVAMKWARLADDAPDAVLFSYEERNGDTGDLHCIQSFDHAQLSTDPVAYSIDRQINPFCGLYRRAAFLRVGGYDLDPEVLYNEDVAFHVRAARRGMTFGADPAVTVINYRMSNSMSQGNLARCIAAHVRVMEKAAEESDPRYHPLIAKKLWHAAGIAGSYLDWSTAERAAEGARKLGHPVPPDGNALYKAVARLQPLLALRIRELAIRRLRPGHRIGAQFHPTR
jgi:glycosyltransferase involved in cell wall biosynthesis